MAYNFGPRAIGPPWGYGAPELDPSMIQDALSQLSQRQAAEYELEGRVMQERQTQRNIGGRAIGQIAGAAARQTGIPRAVARFVMTPVREGLAYLRPGSQAAVQAGQSVQAAQAAQAAQASQAASQVGTQSAGQAAGSSGGWLGPALGVAGMAYQGYRTLTPDRRFEDAYEILRAGKLDPHSAARLRNKLLTETARTNLMETVAGGVGGISLGPVGIIGGATLGAIRGARQGATLMGGGVRGAARYAAWAQRHKKTGWSAVPAAQGAQASLVRGDRIGAVLGGVREYQKSRLSGRIGKKILGEPREEKRRWQGGWTVV